TEAVQGIEPKNSEIDSEPDKKDSDGEVVNATTDDVPSESQAGGVTKEEEATTQDSVSQPPLPPNEWQAVWSPSHNAYYFYNSRTEETTWTNPLVQAENAAPSKDDDVDSNTPGGSTSNAAEPSTNLGPLPEDEDDFNTLPTGQLIDTAALNRIDPALAYLDPTLYASKSAGMGGPGHTFTAKFNARTGRFSTDARDPSHLSEAERAKRMSSVYFDVDSWEKEVAARKLAEANAAADAGSAGEKRKRPTKQDLERFKESKKQKKFAKQAWLRN
ncbi:hypothetical protein FRB97_008932, partial [Tulasnella sp. 331]